MSQEKPKVVRNLTKIKIKEGMIEELTYQEKHIYKNGDQEKVYVNNHKVESSYRPHDDLLMALKALRRFVVDICELGELKPVNIERTRITGVVFSGLDADESAKVMILAMRKIDRSNQEFSINVPLTSLSDKDAYVDCELLDKCTSKIVEEAWKFIFETKRAPDPQLELIFGEGGIPTGVHLDIVKQN